MTIKALYPTVRPTLNLDFAKTKALDPRVTFTRASTGTFVGANGLIQTAAIDVPRFDHNPTTGESLGLLVEEARTNLTLQSEDATGKTNQTSGTATVTVNTTIAPDGNTTADTVAFFSDISNGRFQTSFSSTSGVVYTLSFWVKAISGSTSFSMWDPNSSTIQAFTATSAWQRLSLTFTAASTSASYFVRPIQATNSVASSFAVWGAQIEPGAFPTSYIPTTTATVTRAADVASMTGTNFSSWYNQSQGTLIATTPSGIALTASANQAYFGTSTGTISASLSTGNGIKYGNGSPNTSTRFFVVISSVAQADSNSATNASKIALAYATNNFAMVRSGSVVTDTLGDVPTGMDTFTIRGVGSQSYSRLAYYPVRLPDAQLQALTAT